MAKLMGSGGGRLDPGTQQCMANDRADGTLSQKAAVRGFGAQKYATTGAAGSSVPQIDHDRITHILGQGKLGAATTLAVDAQASGIPIDVLELQKGHFPGTQTQAGEKKQDRVVAPPHCSAAIDLTQQSTYLIGRNPSGNRGP